MSFIILSRAIFIARKKARFVAVFPSPFRLFDPIFASVTMEKEVLRKQRYFISNNLNSSQIYIYIYNEIIATNRYKDFKFQNFRFEREKGFFN